MILRPPTDKIALVCDYLPRKCGIATFSHDLRQAIARQFPAVECLVVPVNDLPNGYDYPPEVRFEIPEPDPAAYRRAADFINFSDAEVVALQHEFGIYGGPAGSHILVLLRELRIPVVTHLHTILEKPKPAFRRVMFEIVERSARLIVMTQRGRQIMEEVYGAAPERIDVIPHGIPDMPFVDPNFYKDQFGVEGRKVIMTFGLLSPNKGIEYVLRALPEVVREFPDVVYIVLGATHPGVVRLSGETYRLKLERLVASLGLTRHVVFYNRFVELEELKEFLGATDIYVTPYLMAEQITSGTLAYAFGCGKAVVSTPYWHAGELLADGRGALVPFRDSAAIARELIGLLRNEVHRHAVRKQAYLLGRDMVWDKVVHQMMASYRKARLVPAHKRLALKTLEQEDYQLPELQLDHLRRLTDRTGILQHATHCVPDLSGGYRTIDNAFALRLAVLLEETGDGAPEPAALASIYAAFLGHAFLPDTASFHDHLSFDRRWIPDGASDENLGAAVWALGTCIGRSHSPGLQRWAAQLFERILPAVARAATPRACALGLLGIHEYFRRLSGDRIAEHAREVLTQRLLDLFRRHERNGWTWFEPALGYANAWLPHALILAGRWNARHEALDTGLRSLRWLLARQTAPSGDFRPTDAGAPSLAGSPARLDQKPSEAAATVAACIEAHAATRDAFWIDEARRAFEWFLGRNDLGESLYDPATGGCCDALHVDRLNLNQGAESTLAFLLALQEMRLLDSALHADAPEVAPLTEPLSAAS